MNTISVVKIEQERLAYKTFSNYVLSDYSFVLKNNLKF